MKYQVNVQADNSKNQDGEKEHVVGKHVRQSLAADRTARHQEIGKESADNREASGLVCTDDRRPYSILVPA